MTSPLNIVFAGTPAFGILCLDAIASSEHTLSAIYTQPDRPAGRGRQVQMSDVKAWALEHQIPVYQPLNFKTQESIDTFAALKPDVMVVIAYGLILPKAILEIPRFGCVNVHASLLPRWRGASPIQHALLHGDKQTGVTIMQMDEGMDTGDMLAIESCTIQAHQTSQNLHDELAQLAVAPLLKTLDALTTQSVLPQKQDGSLATYAPKIKKEQAKINWSLSAADIDQLIRAYYPWPIAFTHANDQLIRIHFAKPLAKKHTYAPGTIISIDKTGILVASLCDCILIEKLQFPGGKVLSVAQWLNANQNHILQPGFILQ